MTPGRWLAVLAGGALYGFGLALSTTVQPEVVIAFLRGQDVGPMFVMGGAVAVTLMGFRIASQRLHRPLLGGDFERHVTGLDRPTLLGSAIFGVGWGLSGVSPGTAIAGLGTGNGQLLWALAGMALGALLQGVSAQHRRSGSSQ